MSDMLDTIIPKSSQINYDDFLAGQSKTIKITKVVLKSDEQPAEIHYEGDNDKPYMPSKGMRRVLVHCWGADASKYVGRSLTLYGDPAVKFGGIAVGGIRISHMSDIKEPITMALTASKSVRKPFTVKPLAMGDAGKANAQTPASPTSATQDWLDAIAKCATMDELKSTFSTAAKAFKDNPDFAKIHEAKEKRKGEINASN